MSEDHIEREIPPLPRPTMTLNLSVPEMSALDALAREKDMSKTAVGRNSSPVRPPSDNIDESPILLR